jgi:tRNA(Ile2) C34 agmatinyltransferase TiaS
VKTTRDGIQLYKVNFHGQERWVSVPERGPVCDRCQNETEPQAGQFRCARCDLEY